MTYMNEQEKRRQFEQFFIIAFPKVKAFAWKILKSENDAEDIAQDVFVKFWDTPDIWEHQETWNSYVYLMSRNHIYNFLKHKSVESSYQEQLAEEGAFSFEADIYDQLYAKEIELLMMLALDNMPERRKKVFLISRQGGMSNQEIADKLQLSVRTVERHIYLVLQELKKIILIAFLFYFN